MPPKSKIANDADMTPTLGSLNKWLKGQDVSLQLDIPGQDMPDCLRYGVLFLDALRTSRHFPGKLTHGESNLLQVVEELSSKVDYSAKGAAPVAAKAPKGKEDKENVPKGVVKKTVKKLEQKDAGKAEKPGPKSRKPAPLAAAAQNQQAKGCGCKGECKTKVCGCQKRKEKCDINCKCLESCVNKVKKSGKQAEAEPESEEDEEEEEEEEQEKEERRVSPKNAKTAGEEIEDDLSDAKESDGGGSDDGLGPETVDWDKHITSLVSCKKCKRNFFPSRITRHEEACKNN